MSAHDGGVALVTGGSRGIGAAIAQSLRDEGWRVATLSRNTRAVGRSPTPTRADYTADVSDAAAVDRAFDDIESDLGPVLALVNNAGRTTLLPRRACSASPGRSHARWRARA